MPMATVSRVQIEWILDPGAFVDGGEDSASVLRTMKQASPDRDKGAKDCPMSVRGFRN